MPLWISDAVYHIAIRAIDAKCNESMGEVVRLTERMESHPHTGKKKDQLIDLLRHSKSVNPAMYHPILLDLQQEEG